jgi:hypothetical protein
VDPYKRDTDEIIQRFWLGQIDGQQCLDSLDSALAGVIQILEPKDLEAAIAVAFFNARLVASEIEWRGQEMQTPRA